MVTVFARNESGDSVRVGSVVTDASGRFRLEADGSKFTWDVALQVMAAAPTPKVLYEDEKPRRHAGDLETWALRLPVQQLTTAGIISPRPSAASDLPALGSVVARAVADAAFDHERQSV